MCGVVGIYSHKAVSTELYDSLIHLQHRGQDAAGIMTFNQRFHEKKGVGYVRDIFDERNMARLEGTMGLGHTRYPTVGGNSKENAQPFWTAAPFGIALAHNGNLVNYYSLVKQIALEDGRHINSTCDAEVLLQLLADGLEESMEEFPSRPTFFEHLCHATSEIFQRASGAYSAVAMIANKGMVAFRDPHGIRPLVYGKRVNEDGTNDYIFASETTMFYALGFAPHGSVKPGEVIYIDEFGEMFSRQLRQEEFSPCIFEYVYFARPDTVMNDISVYRARLRMGQNLAIRWREKFPDVIPDIVIPAPSTANTAALSFAHTLGIRYSEGLYKNPFIGRTFIMPSQEKRMRSVRYKLTPQETEIRDKKVLIVDDSIVRGTTSREIVRMVREFGAREVSFVSACPPVKNPCFYGVDIPTRSELIASNKSEEEIRQFIEADRILFQTLPDLIEAVTRRGHHNIARPCMACLDGNYITGDITEEKIQEMERERNKERRDNLNDIDTP